MSDNFLHLETSCAVQTGPSVLFGLIVNGVSTLKCTIGLHDDVYALKPPTNAWGALSRLNHVVREQERGI